MICRIPHLYWAVFSVNLLTINLSSTFSWTSPSLPHLSSNDSNINPLGKPITTTEESMIASLAHVGGIVGTILSGLSAEKFGRKKSLLFSGVAFIFCHLILANARNVYLMMVCRLMAGTSAGCVLNSLPSYVAEISENSNRGFLCSIFGIASAIGNLCCYAIGPFMSIKYFSYLLIIPATLFVITFAPFVPESPYYFLNKNDQVGAEKALKKLRRNSNVRKEFLYLKEVQHKPIEEKINYKYILRTPATRKGLLLSFGLIGLQQFMGITVIVLYLQSILEASGNIISSSLASIIIGFVQVVAGIVSGFLVDRLGRKILLHVSSIGCCLSLISLGLYFHLKTKYYNIDSIFWLPLASLINYYVFFNIGYSVIPFTICSEIFASDVKSICISITIVFCYITSLGAGASFPFMRDALGMASVFFLFACLSSLSSLFVFRFVPETKGKSFHEIQNILGKNKNIRDSNHFTNSICLQQPNSPKLETTCK